MSRVKNGQKFMNVPKYDSKVYNQSKATKIHFDGEDYHNAKTLSTWLFIKYDMSYKAYRNKSKKRRDELKEEFKKDTGIDLNSQKEKNTSYNNSEYIYDLLDYIDRVSFLQDEIPL